MADYTAFTSPPLLRIRAQKRSSVHSSSLCSTPPPPTATTCLSRRRFGLLLGTLATSAVVSPSHAREGVNRPELLPSEQTPVIDLEKFLASGELRRLSQRVSDLEGRTGFKVRVLTQRFPQTPGLAIRDYWGVDDDTVVMVADYFGGQQLLKFNVGRNVDKLLPPRFWSNLAANYGNKFYTEKNGEAAAIVNSVEAIRACLLRNGCAVPPNLEPTF